MDSWLGQLVGDKYRISKRLGEGGMGAVYEARHESIGRRFAIKFMRAELAFNPSILARFELEAQAAGALESENIAAVTDFGRTDDGAPYIVMEFLQGEDLSRLLTRQGPLPAPRAVSLVIQACRGVEAAHAAGIVHRDLKPENLFVVRRGDGTDLVKVLDFGIAKLRRENDNRAATRTGMALGTPYYMPPEQARGEKELDHRADVYALGIILYELLSGRKPHDGDSYNAILYKILTQSPARLETLRSDLPLGLSDVVHRAMAAEPNARFQNVPELMAELARFSEAHAPAPVATTDDASQRLGVLATVATSQEVRPGSPPATTTAPTISSETPERARSASTRPKWLGAFGIVAIGVVGTAVVVARWSAEPQSSSSSGLGRPEAAPAVTLPSLASLAAAPGPVPTQDAASLEPAPASAPPVTSTSAPVAPAPATRALPGSRKSRPPDGATPTRDAPRLATKSQRDLYAP